MADSLETAQAALQQAQTEFLQRYQDLWTVWLKQLEDYNKQALEAQQQAFAELQRLSAESISAPCRVKSDT